MVIVLFCFPFIMNALPRVESQGKVSGGTEMSRLVDKLSAGEPATEGEIEGIRSGAVQKTLAFWCTVR